jgi:peptidoglycan/LPS O-acetylase OafA/YrhL
MGVIRLLLAVSVVLAHAGSRQLVGGPLAVQAFFIVSGFYMALVLTETYSNRRVFYLNRFLRLYPTYIAVALLTAVVYVIAGDSYYHAKISDFLRLSADAKAYIIVANITLAFQDWTLFMDADKGALAFVKDFRISDLPLYKLLLVPQAWSLGPEIGFYMLAPFLVRLRSIWLALIAIGSLSLRFFAYKSGFDHDPWTYRFFPFELALFVVGMLGYRSFAATNKFASVPKAISLGIFLIPLAFMLCYSQIGIPQQHKLWMFLAAMGVATPFAFKVSANWKWDRLVGELSYPIYLVHLLVIFVIELSVGHRIRESASPFMMMAAAVFGSIFLAAVIHFLVERPVERKRRALADQMSPAVGP